jgi:hypothetical protein
VAPVLVAGRQWREKTVRRVRNLRDGTNRCGNPGIVDLLAHVAVGAQNPKKVAGGQDPRREWYDPP